MTAALALAVVVGFVCGVSVGANLAWWLLRRREALVEQGSALVRQNTAELERQWAELVTASESVEAMRAAAERHRQGRAPYPRA